MAFSHNPKSSKRLLARKRRNGSAWYARNKKKSLQRVTKWLAENPEASIFMQAKQRCTNRKHLHWKNYGGAGIKFCFGSLKELLAEIGPRPGSKYSLGRKNPWGNYEPGNVAWATKDEQQLHTRGAIRELRRIGPKGVGKLLGYLPKAAHGT